MPEAPFKASKRTRQRVMRLVATGMGKRAIAEVLGIAKSTVEIHFAHELEVGRAKCQAELTDLLWKSAKNLSVAAITRLEQRASGEVTNLGLKAIGKKEQQLEAAKNAGGDEWGDLLKIEPQIVSDKPN